jgi:hypothetical protein
MACPPHQKQAGIQTYLLDGLWCVISLPPIQVATRDVNKDLAAPVRSQPVEALPAPTLLG